MGHEHRQSCASAMRHNGIRSSSRGLVVRLLLVAIFCTQASGMAIGAPQRRHQEISVKGATQHPCRRQLLRLVFTATTIANLGLDNLPCNALSPEQASSDYDSYAPQYDQLDGGEVSSLLGLDQSRAQLCRKARGRVLEIGVGTGLNLDKYDSASVSSLTLVDISDGMIREARARVDALNLDFPIDFVRADATTELLSVFGRDRFDTVVDSFSLCVMGNDGAKDCLKQVAQVVKCQKDGGQILLLENTRSSNSFLGMYQDITASTAATAGGKGCVYNQDVGAMIRDIHDIQLVQETPFVSGLFRSFECVKVCTS